MNSLSSLKVPREDLLNVIINNIGLQAPFLALSVLYAPQVVGWFLLADRVLGVPLRIISTAISQVVISEASALKRSGTSVEALFWKAVRQQAILGLPLVGLIPVLPFVFGVLFGKEWREAGVYAAIWIPALVANFVSSPTGGFLDVLERQELLLMREVVRLLLIGGWVLVIAVLGVKETLAILLLTILLVLFSSFYLWTSWYTVKQSGEQL